MIRIGVVGATGYTGLELIRLLMYHSEIRLTYVTSRSNAGKDLNEVFPALKGKLSLKCEEYDINRAMALCDFIFLALPHGLSREIAPKLIRAGKRVVDLGSDFRLKDLTQYEQWYKHKFMPLSDVAPIYGLPELHGSDIQKASLIANPGCFAIATILGMAPLMKEDWIEKNGIIVDAKSGVSGAGRSLSLSSHFSEVTESTRAYKVTVHQHTPEIEQELTNLSGNLVNLNLTTHLIPMSRGIFSTCYVKLRKSVSSKEIQEKYRLFYLEEPFVQILSEGVYPATRDVYGSNTCLIGLKVDERIQVVVIMSVIDNLTKGASGNAIQNMNLMCGFNEVMGLPRMGLVP